MAQVSLDTSFLISFADPNRPHHAVAVAYYRHCVAQRIPMWISSVAAGEFEVGQPFSDLPLQNFRIQSYLLPHAIHAASLYKTLRTTDAAESGRDQRRVIINDIKIIAQAEEDRIPVILTEDANTLSRLASRLRAGGQNSVWAILLAEGFTPGRLLNPAQTELPMEPQN